MLVATLHLNYQYSMALYSLRIVNLPQYCRTEKKIKLFSDYSMLFPLTPPSFNRRFQVSREQPLLVVVMLSERRVTRRLTESSANRIAF